MSSTGRKDAGDVGVGVADEPQSINDIVTAIEKNLLPGPSGTGSSYALIQEQQANGVASTVTKAAGQNYFQRILNTLVVAQDEIASINTDGISVDALSGTYRFRAGYILQTNENVTNSLNKPFLALGDPMSNPTIVTGHNMFYKAGGTDSQDAGWNGIEGRFLLEVTTQISLHFFNNTILFSGGEPVNNDADDDADDTLDIDGTQPEVYAFLELWREGGPIVSVTKFTVDLDPDEPEKAFKIRTPLPDVIINPVQRNTLETHIVSEDINVGQRDWTGINKRTAPHELGTFEAEDALNVDSIAHPGSLQPRKGLVRMKLKEAAHTLGGLAIQDLGIIDSAGSAHMLLAGTNVSPAEQHTAVKQDIIIPPAIRPEFAPTVTLAVVGTTIQVTVSAITAYSGAEAVLVRWHETNHPVSVHPREEKLSENGTTIAWTGELSLIAVTDSVSPLSGTLFVTVWVKTALGYSEPFEGKVTGVPQGAFDGGFDSGMS